MQKYYINDIISLGTLFTVQLIHNLRSRQSKQYKVIKNEDLVTLCSIVTFGQIIPVHFNLVIFDLFRCSFGFDATNYIDQYD